VTSEELILKTALDTIDIEVETLNRLKNSINGAFVECVQSIFDCKGRMVVTGIGKSAIVGKKIVATFNSTGTPAIFMHAADAIHGDLGMIQQDDYVLCISKSGETAEIKVLVPLLKNLGSTLIGMVSNCDSYLARNAHYILHTPVSKEADPNNLAPTASTTAQIAMGDAMATALLSLRGFTPRDFAQFHPGGALGKQLYLRVSDIFPNNEKPAVAPHDSMQAAIMEITGKRLGATAVVADNGKLVGIITDGDLRRMLEKSTQLDGLSAQDIMTSSPKTIRANAMAVKALQIMRQYSITQLVVLDEHEQYVGIVHLHNLITEGLI
jgi:arabinose-5-phosphate isomerase